MLLLVQDWSVIPRAPEVCFPGHDRPLLLAGAMNDSDPRLTFGCFPSARGRFVHGTGHSAIILHIYVSCDIESHGRQVHKLDERRFAMYSAHLRDMYNFDPAAVEQFLKEMRLLSASGQTSAQAMKTKLVPLHGAVATNNTQASGHDDDVDEGISEAENAGVPKEGGTGAAGNRHADGKRDGCAGMPSGLDQPRGPQRCFMRVHAQ